MRDPATRLLFYVKKEESKVNEYAEVFPLEDGAEKTALESVLAGKSEMTDQARTAIKGSLETLSKWKADFPNEVNTAVAVLAKAVGYGDDYGPTKKSDEKMSDEDTKKKDEEEKAAKDLVAAIRTAMSALQSAVAKLPGSDEGEEDEKPEDEEGGESDKKGDKEGFTVEDLVNASGEALKAVVKEVTG